MDLIFSWCDGFKRWSRCNCVEVRFGSLSAKCANKTLVPPIARQACRLDHKPKTVTTATPQNQVSAPRRHFVICYSLFHTFCPKLIGSSLLLHKGCHVADRTSVCFEGALVQRLRAVRKSG